MPSSTNKPPDELAKDLYPYLAHQYRHFELARLGWFDFVNHDCPDEGDAVVVAFEAFTHLFIDAGIWIRHTGGLLAILAFLRDQTGQSPTIEQVRALKAILDGQPVIESDLEDWFYATFP